MDLMSIEDFKKLCQEVDEMINKKLQQLEEDKQAVEEEFRKLRKIKPIRLHLEAGIKGEGYGVNGKKA